MTSVTWRRFAPAASAPLTFCLFTLLYLYLHLLSPSSSSSCSTRRFATSFLLLTRLDVLSSSSLSSSSSSSSLSPKHVLPSCYRPLGASPNGGIASAPYLLTVFMMSSSSSSSSSLSLIKHTIPWCDCPLGASPNGPFSLYLYCTRVVNIVVDDTRKNTPYRGVTVRWGRPLTAIPVLSSLI